MNKFLEDYRQMEAADFRYFHQENTRWGDADALGHINNVLYSRYFESARVSYLQKLLSMNFDKDVSTGMILADMKISFLQQMHHPAEMHIGTRISRLGSSSLHIDAAVFLQGNDKPMSTSRATLVFFDYSQNSPIVIPDDVRDTITKYEKMSPLQP